MECLARCRLTVFSAQGTCGHAMPDVVRLCVKSKDKERMKRSTFFNRMCCPRYTISCHTRRSLTMCFSQRQWWHATPDVVRPYVISKGNDYMPRRTLSDRLFCPMALMACHAQCRATICISQRTWWHATPYVFQSCLLSKGDDNMLHMMPFDHVYFPMAKMECHGRRRLSVCAFQGKWIHAT